MTALDAVCSPQQLRASHPWSLSCNTTCMPTFAVAVVAVLAVSQDQPEPTPAPGTEAPIEVNVESERIESPRDNYILSARGPVEGEHVFGVGGALVYVLPSVDGRWVWAIDSMFYTDIQLKTIGVLTVVDATARIRFVGGEWFSLALRAGIQSQGLTLSSSDDGTGFNLAGGGGVMLSFGPEWLQWTINAEVYGGYSTGTEESATFLNNTVGVEFPVHELRNMFVELRLLTVFHRLTTVPLSIISLGVAW